MRRIWDGRASSAVTVVALALVAALAGTAIAGPNAETSGKADNALNKAKKALKKSKKNKQAIKDIELTPGPQGPQGEQGQQGQQGEPGSDAARATFAHVDGLTDTAAVFGAVSGTSTVAADGQSLLMHSPNAAIVARDLFVELENAPGGALREIKLLVGGNPTDVECQITEFQTSCNSGANSAVIPPGSELLLQFSGSGPSNSTDAYVSWRATTP